MTRKILNLTEAERTSVAKVYFHVNHFELYAGTGALLGKSYYAAEIREMLEENGITRADWEPLAARIGQQQVAAR